MQYSSPDMVDKKPLLVKSTSASRKKKKIRGLICINHYQQNKTGLDPPPIHHVDSDIQINGEGGTN